MINYQKLMDRNPTSYDTLVAKIDYDERTASVSNWYSQTTSKHINYACERLGLQIIQLNK